MDGWKLEEYICSFWDGFVAGAMAVSGSLTSLSVEPFFFRFDDSQQVQ